MTGVKTPALVVLQNKHVAESGERGAGGWCKFSNLKRVRADLGELNAAPTLTVVAAADDISSACNEEAASQ